MIERSDQLLAALSEGQRISGRYRIENAIGQGGVACVARAYDEREQRHVAIKCMLPQGNPRAYERLSALFHYEYLVLSQLVHPNVVSVYDFGFADGRPYYTMELLDGSPLSEAAPLPVATVVELMRRLCDPLSIMHARRWVHRDLSPRNVIITLDQRFKLIDFGATVSMDDNHLPMGTPPYMAPEVLHQESLDARADVFGLGALAYFALTGHKAYPARTMARLPALWAQLPTRPRELAPHVPEALDNLIMAMISVERSGRPRVVAEVLHRLQGGSRESLPPSTATARACLETPKLIGRDAQVTQARALLRVSAGGRGTVCAIRGKRGSGRTRMLDTFGLEGRLAGHAVMRASAKQTGAEPLALAKTLGQALLYLLSEEEDSARNQAAPAWLRAEEDFGGEGAQHRIANAQRGFVDWVGQLCERTPVVLLVDDVELADLESQKLLAQLALLAKKRRLIVAVALGTEAPERGNPLRILIDRGTEMQLAPLCETEVEDWVRSVFGDVHNVARLSRWLYPVSEGRPAACMALAEHLVEHGVAVFAAGNFRLPDSFEGLSLPGSVREALHAQLSTLGSAALQFLSLLAIDFEPRPLDITEYLDAFAMRGGDRISAISELTGVRVLSATANGYALSNASALDWARQQLDAEATLALHRELAELYRKAKSERDPSIVLYVAYHLWKSGGVADADRTLDELDLVPNLAISNTSSGLSRFSCREEAIAMYEALLRYREAQRASPRRILRLRTTLLTLASTTKPELAAYADETLARLNYDVGLDHWDATPADLPEHERFVRCLQAADARQQQTPEAERGVPPLEALRYLVPLTASLSGVYAIRYEPEALWPLYRNILRMRGLSPVVQLVCDVTEVAYKSLAYGADMSHLQQRIVDATSQPLADLPDVLRHGLYTMYCYYLGMVYAAEGNHAALELVSGLEAQPQYAALGLQVRRVHALMTGRYREAQRYRRERELLALQSEANDQTLHMSLLREMLAAADCGDVIELTRYVSAMRKRARRFAGWKPWATLGVAFTHFEAEEYKEVCAELDPELHRVPPLSHGAWQHMAALKAAALAGLGDYAGAAEIAHDALRRARALEIRLEVDLRLRSVLAFCEVGQGAVQAGRDAMNAVLTEIAATSGRASVRYGMACEYQCRMALMMVDERAFREHHAQLTEVYKNHPALRARYERLGRRARQQFETTLRDPTQAGAGVQSLQWAERLQTALATQSVEDQADSLLSLLLDEADSELGQLYRVDAAGQPRLIACRPKAPDPKLLIQAQRWCQTFGANDETVTHDMVSVTACALDSQGTQFQPIWLPHPGDPDKLLGMLLVPANAPHLSALTPGLRRAVSVQLTFLAA